MCPIVPSQEQHQPCGIIETTACFEKILKTNTEDGILSSNTFGSIYVPCINANSLNAVHNILLLVVSHLEFFCDIFLFITL